MSYPILILGGGLAGTSLAWQLHWRGVPFLLVDRETGDGASRVAAGLITPVTGQRLIPSWRFDEFFPFAEAFYRRVENETARRFFHRKRALRLFRDADEVSRWPEARRVFLDADDFFAPFGCLDMDAARLDASAFLDASKLFFRSRGRFRTADIDAATDLRLVPDGVDLPRLGIAGQKLVFCQGDFGRGNPWFDWLPFQSAKGEILTLEIPGLREERVLHGGVWLLPLGDGVFRAGGTYRWQWDDALPTEEGREEILAQLRQFLKRPFGVIGHEAGIRPILESPSRPTVGFRGHLRLSLFNGLGSKGCLLAPHFSDQLADMLTGQAEPRLLTPEQAERVRPTEEVHRLLKETLRPGEHAVDATAGNGQDTLALARCVGAGGHVYAFDVQKEALTRTRARLESEGASRVTLLHRNHAEMRNVLPESLWGNVGAVVFNLGYLPGGEKAITTRTGSTLLALETAFELLRPGGILTVVAYTGHPGGLEEARAVGGLLHDLSPTEFDATETPSDPGKPEAPRLFVVRRKPRG